MKALIVEDSQEKAAAIVAVLRRAGLDSSQICSVPDMAAAKNHLVDGSVYDLLVLDLLIPLRFEERVRQAAGVDLLRWVQRKSPPRAICIVALSAYEIRAEERATLSSFGVLLVRYSQHDDSWREALDAVARRMMATKPSIDQRRSKHGQCDVAVLTTVQVEHEAALAVFEAGAPFVEGGETWSMGAVAGQPVVVGQASQMGMPAAAFLAARTFYTWRPRLVLLVGICGGVKPEVDFGDIVVPDPVWDYGSGKISEKGLLHPDPRPLQLGTAMRTLIRSLLDGEQESLELNSRCKLLQCKKPRHSPKVLMAPSGSGAAVVQNSDVIADIQSHNRKLTSIDMESYGFYFAMEGVGNVAFASVKSVVDFADREKDDDFQDYGSRVSCQFAQLLIARWLEGIV